MGTIYTAIAILGMTAILGMYLLSLILRNKSTPKGITIIHGVLAASALILLIAYCIGNTPDLWAIIIVFIVAATMGFVLAYRNLTGKSVPKGLGIFHGLTAVLGFALLLYFAFG